MIDILAASGLISPDRLNVTARIGADPDIAPGWRYHEAAYALRFLLGDRLGFSPHKLPHPSSRQSLDRKGLDVGSTKLTGSRKTGTEHDRKRAGQVASSPDRCAAPTR